MSPISGVGSREKEGLHDDASPLFGWSCDVAAAPHSPVRSDSYLIEIEAIHDIFHVNHGS